MQPSAADATDISATPSPAERGAGNAGRLKPWETTGMVVLQAESEVASINMLYGGGGTGKRVMTSSSSVGIA